MSSFGVSIAIPLGGPALKLDNRSRYNASGRGKVTAKRNCKTKTTKNPDWSPQNPGDYQDISATCKDSDSTIEINKISGVA